jgi:UDP-N-acetylmuramate dehydrogenase
MKIIDFKKYTSLHIGEKHPVKIINNIEMNESYTIIGKCQNILISNNPPKLAILGDKFDYIFQKNNKLFVGAATSSGKLLTFCRKNNIANFEFLAKLPGSIGGLVKMNAGLKEYETFNHLHSIKTKKGEILKKDIQHTYRHTNINNTIYEACFEIQLGYSKEKQNMFIKMRDNQPNLPSAGSCFKNPQKFSAGYLIEHVGLKGYQIGDMAFSSLHANFLVNLGEGSFQEALQLINLAKDKVYKKFDINLEMEIVIL